jgi:hypothetical protein
MLIRPPKILSVETVVNDGIDCNGWVKYCLWPCKYGQKTIKCGGLSVFIRGHTRLTVFYVSAVKVVVLHH